MDAKEMRFGRNVLAASLCFFGLSLFAQQAVMVPVPGASMGLQGDLYGSGASGIILTHGGGRTKESWRSISAVIPSTKRAG